jgi:hypothetical protein
MKKKRTLSTSELEFIQRREADINAMLKELKKVQAFRLGDFLIAFNVQPWNSKRNQVINSYGAPKKFQVVHVDSNGIPYMKELNKKGTPVGILHSPVEIDQSSSRIVKSSNFEFEVDPDYEDSIIMMDEENYDSAMIHRTKSDTFKEITAHNKSHKIYCGDRKQLADYFDKNVKVGTVLHKSSRSFITIIEISKVPRDNAGRVKDFEDFCKVQDSKGNISHRNISDFVYTALYSAQPRSYNELKDPK